MFFFADKGLSYLLKTQTALELIHLKLGSLHTQLGDKCLSMLRSPKLVSVKLQGLDQLTNNGVITLAKNCPNICELMLPGCSELNDGCIQTVTTTHLKGKLVSYMYSETCIKRTPGGTPIYRLYRYVPL